MREQRLIECAGIIGGLLRGEEISHGGLVNVDRARLWTRPTVPPPLAVAALSVESVHRHAGWAEGLVTVDGAPEHLRSVLEAYRDGGGGGLLRRQVHLSWAPTEQEAAHLAHDQWRSNTFGTPVSWDLATTEAFDVISGSLPLDAVRAGVRISSDLGEHAAWLAALADLGFDELYLHHVGQHQERFIDAFGEHVLPQVAPA